MKGIYIDVCHVSAVAATAEARLWAEGTQVQTAASDNDFIALYKPAYIRSVQQQLFDPRSAGLTELFCFCLVEWTHIAEH